MENKKAYYKALIHVVCCVIIILLFVLTTMRVNAMDQINNLTISTFKPLINRNVKQVRNTKYDKPRIIENNIYVTLEKYSNTINFFRELFGFPEEFVKEDLIKRNITATEFSEKNIGGLTKNNELISFSNVEQGISEYFFEIAELYPEKRDNKFLGYTGDSEYIEKLIIYYTNIYQDVDTTLALSIGAAESGYYKVKYMLQKNNVYGGMGKNGLIVYDNIEIGVLKYIRLLYNNYFKKGLTTKETIGRKYCPQYNENGEKVASAHWINLVSKAETKYKNYINNIKIEDIIN